METSPQLQNCPDFGPKKQFPVNVLRRLQMTCASELKPHIHNNEDPGEKIHQFINVNLKKIKYWYLAENIMNLALKEGGCLT